MPQYDFDPAGCEIAFGDEQEGLPAWRMDLGRWPCACCCAGGLTAWTCCQLHDDTALAVVMDYKSRVRKLDPTKLHHGLELQLLSYLGVLQHLPAPESRARRESGSCPPEFSTSRSTAVPAGRADRAKTC